jgi:hypothetical protein
VRGAGVLKVLLVASIVSTGIHYTDNFIAISTYPGTDTLDPSLGRAATAASWIVLTAIGLLGYRLYIRGRHPAAEICLAIYSVTGISTLGHYLSGGTSRLPVWRHVSITSDGILGLAILAFAFWAVTAQPWSGAQRAVSQRVVS